MRTLTVCEPFASALVFGGKDIENRQSSLGIVGPTIIHAGKSLKWYTPELCEWVHERWPECPANRVAAMDKFQGNHGRVLGVLWFGEGWSIDDIPPTKWDLKWATGPWCMPVYGKPVPVKPFPARGFQGCWMLPAAQCPSDVMAAADKLAEEFGLP